MEKFGHGAEFPPKFNRKEKSEEEISENEIEFHELTEEQKEKLRAALKTAEKNK